MSLFPEVDLDSVEAEAIARGLLSVALCDGAHERELALIADFYQSLGHPEPGTRAFASLERVGPLDPPALATILVGKEQRELFIRAAMLLAWADGSVSASERAEIGGFSAALSVDDATVARLEAEVKDYLLRPFATLANTDAVRAVAKRLAM